MKSILESTLKWFKGEPAADEPATPVFVPQIVPSLPQVETEARSAPVVEDVQSEPVVTFSSAPEVSLRNKAGTVYATCPHCTAIWNLRERLMRPRRTQITNEITCPACDQAVSVRKEALAK